ncbi:hypothetical protein VNO78_23659 [Psophocarpus tetragonolobus]|uniref:Uncharacterized protein n=1 Tax=Psophocarpus tetragonolobus TaxID=3891 RepID=A0AAN9S417_PSOTE
MDSFPVPPLALKRLQSPRGQEKSNKRPSLDCCSFKPLKQREIPCSSLEQRPMEKVVFSESLWLAVRGPASRDHFDPHRRSPLSGVALLGGGDPFFTRGAGKEEAPILVLASPAPRGSNTYGALIARSGTNLWLSPIHTGPSILLLGGILGYIGTGKDTGQSCAFPTLARKRCETRFFNHYFSSTLNSILSGSRSGGSLFTVPGATGGSGSRLRTSESFDPKHQNIDH